VKWAKDGLRDRGGEASTHKLSSKTCEHLDWRLCFQENYARNAHNILLSQMQLSPFTSGLTNSGFLHGEQIESFLSSCGRRWRGGGSACIDELHPPNRSADIGEGRLQKPPEAQRMNAVHDACSDSRPSKYNSVYVPISTEQGISWSTKLLVRIT